jgi:beta-1,4-N-acetylglucosaminyltransferase
MHFDRLLKPMDLLAAELDERVVMQCGCSNYTARYAEAFQFTTSDHIDQLTADARVIVCHAAAGSAIAALRQHKPLVVVPRQERFHEHVDDHQLQLAAALDEQGRAAVVYEPSVVTLRAAIEKAPLLVAEFKPALELGRFLRRQLDAWQGSASSSARSQPYKVKS